MLLQIPLFFISRKQNNPFIPSHDKEKEEKKNTRERENMR
jgi:hypothetical protein